MSTIQEFTVHLRQLVDSGKIGITANPGNNIKIEEIREYMGGHIPPHYEAFLKVVGHGGGGELNIEIFGTGFRDGISSLKYQAEIEKTASHYPDGFIFLCSDGSEISYYFDTNIRIGDEYQIVGRFAGTPENQQPSWLREEEIYNSFEDFFRTHLEADSQGE